MRLIMDASPLMLLLLLCRQYCGRLPVKARVLEIS